MTDEPAWKRYWWTAAPLIAILIAGLTTGAWDRDVRIPYSYHNDAFIHHALVKAVVESGWWLHAPGLGAPNPGDWHDFPVNSWVHFGLIKAIAWFTSDWAVVINVCYLLSFPLACLTAIAAGRAVGLSRTWASVSALLYAFLPYHAARNEHHLLLATYYLAPLGIWLAATIVDGSPMREPGRRRPNRRGWLAIAAAVLIAGDYPYYTVFSCLFLALSAGFAWLRRGDRPAAIRGAALVGLVMGVYLLGNAPIFLYKAAHGPNPAPYHEVNARHWSEIDDHGLRLTALLLPTPRHPLSKLADLGSNYQNMGIVKGDQTSSLGIAGAIGLVGLLLGIVRLGRPVEGPLRDHGDWMVVLAWLLLAIGGTGGLMTLSAMFAGAVVRSPNRLVVYLGWLAIVGFAAGMQRWQASRVLAGRVKFASAIPMVVLAMGLADQGALTWPVTPESRIRPDFLSERTLVRQLESELPRGSMVFTLPYSPMFSTLPAIHNHGRHDHFRPYLHSRSLRWSFGAMYGRADDAVHASIADQPMDAMLESLAVEGYSAVWIDRAGYSDQGRRIESDLESRLGRPAEVSPGGRFSAFRIDRWSADHRARLGPEQVSAIQAGLRKPRAFFGSGFRAEPSRDSAEFAMAPASIGKVVLVNYDREAQTVRLTIPPARDDPEDLILRMTPTRRDGLAIASARPEDDGDSRVFELTIPPGVHKARLERLPVPGAKLARLREPRLELLEPGAAPRTADRRESGRR